MQTELFDTSRVSGFLHTKGRVMVNGNGEEVILRGLGAGNWNNPEGFMIGAFSDFQVPVKKVNSQIGRMDRGRSFSALVRELCGTQYEEDFWPVWYRNHLGEADIRQMAQWGMNSIRLPLDARTLLYEEPGIQFNESTFTILDEVLAWCEKYHLYAILDLHAAVGGQSALPCDDGVDGMPHLFYDEESWERTMILCEELAKRYADKTIVGGYDLINEPLSGPVWEEYVPKLKEFYKEMVARMRKYDTNHMLLLNGHVFSSRVDMFDEDFDPKYHNWGLAIHNYGSLPQYDLFAASIAKSAELDIPVWFGEGGGSGTWMTAMYELALEHHIGFNVWCYKAADAPKATTGFARYPLPKEWQMIIDYAKDGGIRPSYLHAQEIFDEYLELIKYENCRIYDGDVSYIMRKPGCCVPAVAYDDIKEDGQKAFKGSYPYGNAFHYRISDGMHIVAEPNYISQLGVIGPQDAVGDWDHYELALYSTDFVTYTLRDCHWDNYVNIIYRSAKDASIRVLANDSEVYVGGLEAGNDYHILNIQLDSSAQTISLSIQVISGTVVLGKVEYK